MKRVFLGGTLLFLSATATFAENDTNQAQTPRMGFINMQKVLEESQSTQGAIGQTLHNSINDPNLLILTDGVIYANEKLDLTQSFISDDYRISSESQKKLNELLVNSKIKIGYINIPQLLERIPEAENAKKKLQTEFPGNDSVTFSEKFNIRRNEELKGIQTHIVSVIRNIAKIKGFDLLLTDGVIYAGKSNDMTEQVRQAIVEEDNSTNRNTTTLQQVVEVPTSANAIPLHSEEFSKLEATCLSIGFKKGTEPFGDCVLELKNRVKQVK